MKRASHAVLMITFLSTLVFLQIVYASYENTEHRFSIDGPAGWSISEDQDGVEVGFLDDATGSSINVVVEETNMRLSQYVDASLENVILLYEDYTVESEGSRILGELRGYEVVATITEQEFGLGLKLKQAIFVENGKGYVITAGALESEYDNVLATFEQSIESFRITSSGSSGINSTVVVVAIVAAIVIVAVIIVFFFLRTRQK